MLPNCCEGREKSEELAQDWAIVVLPDIIIPRDPVYISGLKTDHLVIISSSAGHSIVPAAIGPPQCD